MDYWLLKLIKDAYLGYWNYLSKEISTPHLYNYFYWLIGISLFCWLLEIIIPWRKNQKIIRTDFWKDAFYMFFNFFLFSLIAFNALSNIGVELFQQFLGVFQIKNLVALNISILPSWAQLVIFFLLSDFIQWNVHRLLHKSKRLWEFHKLHHSVKEMGFAAHLRFHWMESIIYKSILFIPMSMLGFGILNFFYVHLISIVIGHLNHSNIKWSYGPLKYIINNPMMHIWHHAKELPDTFKNGANFGISLSIWDYLFKTNYLPESGRDIELGFDGDEKYPQNIVEQMSYPIIKKK